MNSSNWRSHGSAAPDSGADTTQPQISLHTSGVRVPAPGCPQASDDPNTRLNASRCGVGLLNFGLSSYIFLLGNGIRLPLEEDTRPAGAGLVLYKAEAHWRIAASRSYTACGDIDPRLNTGMPRASAIRMAIPVPPDTRPAAVHAMHTSTGRSRVLPSCTTAFLACSLRTGGEQRPLAGRNGAAISIHFDSAAEGNTRQSGPRCPLERAFAGI